ncbi:hypothetical protein [Chitinophaga flava]|uniref:Outer membrane protein beta-barrel domain-containing protein n=1 Tax=Chitinophaga flava TaxID=2259036 RepID=A0A365Y6H3_9BACT|nr:hypothetical protein [Chitinophaga flava]RBL93495.1 hypothetical protein DF182_13350 [Chitinophaga flava]
MSEEFENKIRDRLSEADFPFDPVAWEKMERMLDEEDKDRKTIFIWWTSAAMLLLVLVAWWLMYNPSDNVTEVTYQPEKKEDSKRNKTSWRTTETAVKTPVPIVKPPVIWHQQHICATISNKATQIQASEEHKEVLMPISGLNANDYTNKYNLNEYTKINLSPNHIATIAFYNQDSAIKRPLPRRKKWDIGVVAGPDFTVAPSFKYGNLGVDAGILLYYYFDPKIFVATGVIYNKKMYGAAPEDYQNSSVNIPYDKLEKISASCSMLDIPLNLNYTFLSGKKDRTSATLGLSNYFMLKEKYRYQYEYTDPKELTIQNQRPNYLSVLNAGILYQREVSHQLLLGIQPYVKIPLNGVGYGQVKLYSAGITLQLTLTR